MVTRRYLIIIAAALCLPCVLHAVKGRFPDRGSFEVISHSISVELEPESSYIYGSDYIVLNSGGGLKKIGYILNPDLAIVSMGVDGKFFPFSRSVPGSLDGLPGFEGLDAPDLPDGSSLVTLDLNGYGSSRKKLKLYVEYEGEIKDPVAVGEFSREYIADQTSGIISEEGVFLSPGTFWYPYFPGALCAHSLEAKTPAGFEVVTQGSLAARKLSADTLTLMTRWEESHPSDGIHLISGPYTLHKLNHGGIDVIAYLFSEEADIAPDLLRKCCEFIDIYENMLTPYPFEKFAVVENFFPTGYGMPSYTLIGKTIIRLPFLINISLGHEIAHNWWGNSVFVDDDSGNWCEGLTSYTADYYYKEMEGPEKAREYRRNLLRDYSDYVKDENDFSLSEFTNRTSPDTRAVGYGKAAMVFHQVRNMIGDDEFFEALRLVIEKKQWSKASWDDFRKAFEKTGDTDMRGFFRQWVDREGAPSLRLASVETEPVAGKGCLLSLTLEQDFPFFSLDIPVVVTVTGGEGRGGDAEEEVAKHLVHLDSERVTVSLQVPGTEGFLDVDPAFDLFRRLLPGEIPPTLSRLLGNERTMLVIAAGLSDSLADAYSDLAERLRHGSSIEIFSDPGMDEVTKQIAERPYLLLGPPESFESLGDYLPALESDWAEYFGEGAKDRSSEGGDGGWTALAVREHPGSIELAGGIFSGTSPDAVFESGRKLPHYGKYTDLLFKDGNIKGKEIRERKDPLLRASFSCTY